MKSSNTISLPRAKEEADSLIALKVISQTHSAGPFQRDLALGVSSERVCIESTDQFGENCILIFTHLSHNYGISLHYFGSF